jgi:PAS domain S-box-containing protein
VRLLPQSLLGRVYALYAVTLIGVSALGLALFLWQQVGRQVGELGRDARALTALVVPVVRDAAVIGDYDTIRRQLDGLAQHSSIDAADFHDPTGGRLQRTHRVPPGWAPAWLTQWVAQQLQQPAVGISAGGQVYGELRLTLAAESIAGNLWHESLWAAALAALGVAGGMALIRPPLKRWLGQLESIGQLGQGLEGGQQLARRMMMSDAPVEFRRTFEVLDRAAASLQVQREQAAATLQAIDDAVLACSIDGRVILANDAAQRLLQREEAAILGRAVTDLLPALADVCGADLTLGRHWQHRQLLWHDPQGRLHVLDANLSPIVDGEGQHLGQVLACRDVTEQHRRDEAMRELNAARDSALAALRRTLEDSAGRSGQPARATLGDIEAVSTMVARLVLRLHEHGEQLDAIFALSPDGFVSFDSERRVRYCSPGFGQLTGLSPDMVLGLEEAVFLHRLRSRCDGPTEAARLDRWQATAATDRRLMVTLKQPRHRVVELALHTGRATAVSQVLHLRDVTRETEVDRLKSEFVAAAAHELRTPMVGIFGYSELLITRDMPVARQKDLLARIHRQCEVMVAILNEMLDLARMEARRGSDFEFAPVSLAAVVSQTLADHCPPPDRAPALWHAPEHDPLVHADAVKLQRALRNLLSNAYKYSPAGGDVVVRVMQDPAQQRVGVAVVDHGIGMKPEQLARVGERFYRADDSGTVLGTGLGMSLVLEIVSLHAGTVELHSTPGQGTTATLWLPLLQDLPVDDADAMLARPA